LFLKLIGLVYVGVLGHDGEASLEIACFLLSLLSW